MSNNKQKTNTNTGPGSASTSGPSMDDFSYPQSPGSDLGSKDSNSDDHDSNNTQQSQDSMDASQSPTPDSSGQNGNNGSGTPVGKSNVQSGSTSTVDNSGQSQNNTVKQNNQASNQVAPGGSSTDNRSQKPQSKVQDSKGTSGGGKSGSSIADLAKKLSGWKDDFLKGEQQSDSGQQQVPNQQNQNVSSAKNEPSDNVNNKDNSKSSTDLPSTKPGSGQSSESQTDDTQSEKPELSNENTEKGSQNAKDPAELLKQLSKAEKQSSQVNENSGVDDTQSSGSSDTDGASQANLSQSNNLETEDKDLSGSLEQQSPLTSADSNVGNNSMEDTSIQESNKTEQAEVNKTQGNAQQQQVQVKTPKQNLSEPNSEVKNQNIGQQSQGTKEPQTESQNDSNSGTLQPDQNSQSNTDSTQQDDLVSGEGSDLQSGQESTNSEGLSNNELSQKLKSNDTGDEGERVDTPKASVSSNPQSKPTQVGKYPHTIAKLLELVIDKDASDLHITVGYPAMMRIDGKLEKIGTDLITQETAMDLILPVLPENKRELLEVNREVDLAYAFRDDARFRVNAYYERGRPAMAMRLIPNKIRSIEELKLPGVYHQFAKVNQGFVLVTGPTGHGKSTTLAAILQEINENYQKHIITIEDPIEYIYPQGRALVDQREMHEDTHSWEIALRSALRQDPDVVLVGEMRDYETIGSAITLAETGHLVFATLHTNNAAQTVDRIIDVFPEHQQEQVRSQLSNIIEAIISQRLVAIQGGGRRAVSEILICNPAVKNLIREGKTHQIDNVIRTSKDIGMRSLEQSLVELVREGLITVEQAEMNAVHPEEVVRLLK